MSLETLTASIKRHEGYRLLPYTDTRALWTIAWGKLIDGMPIPRECSTIGELLDWITDAKRHQDWLEADIFAAITDAKAYLGESFPAQPEVVRDVLSEMAYQLGYAGLKRFERLRMALLRGDRVTAAYEGMNSAWAKQTPERANELMDLLHG